MPDGESERNTKWLAKVRRVTRQEKHGMLSEKKEKMQQTYQCLKMINGK